MKKKLNMKGIQNEIAAGSAFFERPAPLAAQADKKRAEKTEAKNRTEKTNANTQRMKRTDKAHDRTDGTGVRPYALIDRIPARPYKRRPERYSFQFWTDQITRLKKLKQVLNIAGDPEDREEITLSDMVRQAVDEYLDRRTKEISKNDRTHEQLVRPNG